MSRGSVDALLADAEAKEFSGWDFSWLDARSSQTKLPWSYRAEVSRRGPAAGTTLDTTARPG